MIYINYKDSRPIFQQVKEGFRNQIVSGLLQDGWKMPSVRELATTLAINPNTIQRAYRELEAEGYICTVPGKGSFVSGRDLAARARRQELRKKLGEVMTEMKQAGLMPEEIREWVREDLES